MFAAPNRFADSEGSKYTQSMCLCHRGIEGRRARRLSADGSYELMLPFDDASAQVIALAITATASTAGARLALSLQLQTL